MVFRTKSVCAGHTSGVGSSLRVEYLCKLIGIFLHGFSLACLLIESGGNDRDLLRIKSDNVSKEFRYVSGTN